MIRLDHVVKHYRRDRGVRFAVTNDISLTFPAKGLVIILGASGSGKTTLLNLLCGLDRFDTGSLTFDDQVFTTYDPRRWDGIRRSKVGYVNQSFHLLKDESVFANIALILRMQGIVDPALLRERVDRLLGTVGLSAYADRLVRQLSGGQQQRVAFARALANDPKVILADEPTGNLDGRTTIELMNVIAAIAKTRLVVMVTHEQLLSRHFADRIIEIDNGTIVRDEENVKVPFADDVQEHVLRLGDFAATTLAGPDTSIRRFVAPGTASPLDIDLIERHRTLYLNIRSGGFRRVRTIGSDSEIVVEDGASPAVAPTPTPLEVLLPPSSQGPVRRVFSWRETIRQAFRGRTVFRRGGKLLFLALLLVGLVVATSLGLVGEILHVEEPYSVVDRHYVTVDLDRVTYAQALALEDVPGVDQLLLVNRPAIFHIAAKPYLEVAGSIAVEALPIDISFLDPALLVAGTMPEGYGVVVDRTVADDILRDNAGRGLATYDDVLSCRVKLQTSGIDTDLSADAALYFPISGIADANSKSIWMKEELAYSLLTPYLVDVRVLGDGFSVVSGALPQSASSILLNDQYPSVRDGFVPYGIGIANGSYSISGVYHYERDGFVYDLANAMVTSLPYIKSRYFTYAYGNILDINLLVYAEDVEAALVGLADAGYTATANRFEPTLAQELKLQENATIYLIGLVGLLVSAVGILLVMRTSLISRLYEIGVYRGVGISRREIARMFFVEILLLTTVTSVAGFLLAVAGVTLLQAQVPQFTFVRFTPASVLLGVAGLYLTNLVFGLLPVALLLQRTPAGIMRQTDI